jgi:hypothetical protein
MTARFCIGVAHVGLCGSVPRRSLSNARASGLMHEALSAVHDDGGAARSRGMQTRRQSRLEVAVDWLFMRGVNIGGQLVAYGMLATTWRAGTFAAATIILAVPRRYTTRRVFNRVVP